jgi:CRP-like cAMP-binding protein
MPVTVSHLCASIFLYVGTFGSPRWMDRGVDYGALPDEKVWDHYLVSFYFVVSTFRTQGTVGELTPSTFQEMAFSCLLMILTITFFAYVLGEISSLIMNADDEVAEARGKQAMVDNYINSKHGMTVQLAEEIRSYSRNASSQGQSVDLAEIYKLMSHSLQIQVAECISRDMLDDIPLFKDCSDVFLDSVSVMLREGQYSPGEVVFRTGEISRHLYIISSGSVERAIEIEGEEPTPDGKSCAGQCVGDLSFFFGMRHIFTCTAAVQTSCFLLERNVFQQLLQMYPDEEGVVASNALNTYEHTVNRAGSMHSGKSGTSGRSYQDEIEKMVGGNLKHTIHVLKNRRKMDAVERALKATARGNCVELRKLFLSGVNVNSSNREGRTPLHVAACNGQEETLKLLLDDMGADLNPVDKHGNTPMNDAGIYVHYSLPLPIYFICHAYSVICCFYEAFCRDIIAL